MKKIFIGIISLLFFVACKHESPEPKSEQSDSLTSVSNTDSLLLAEAETKHPEADGLFDDFIYLFMQDHSLQLDRIDFPLLWDECGVNRNIEKKQWKHDPIYLDQSENTLIVDGNHMVEEENHASLKTATVEWFDLKSLLMKKYMFSRMNDQWRLTKIVEENYEGKTDNDFYVFYSRFTNDEDYQMKHIHNPFYFKTFDSDNEEEIKGWVAAEQWPAYRIYMPADKINNIVYDNKVAKSNYRNFVISSPSSGMNCNLIFKFVNHRWQLVRMEN